MSKMVKVRFVVDRVVDDCRKGTSGEERYEAGKVYDLTETSAVRWINRGAAVAVVAGERAAPASAQDPEPAEAGDDADDAVEALRVEAASLGIDVNPRWGAKRLQREIDLKRT